MSTTRHWFKLEATAASLSNSAAPQWGRADGNHRALRYRFVPFARSTNF
jgi:hypothetical protein